MTKLIPLLCLCSLGVTPAAVVQAGGEPLPQPHPLLQSYSPPNSTLSPASTAEGSGDIAMKATPDETSDDAASTDTKITPLPRVEPYKLGYKTEINGVGLKSNRVLTEQSDGLFKLYGKASLLFIAIEEYSLFRQDSAGQIQPVEYFYDRKGLGDKKDFNIHFNWQDSMVTNQLRKDPWSLPIEPGMQDMLSHQEQFRLELNHSPPGKPYRTYAYTIVKKKKIKHYRYTPIGEEIINTEAGTLRTLKVEKEEDDDDRRTSIWLAMDWGYVIARLEYIKGDDSHRMELIGGNIGGTPITGLTDD
jgi:Protein of unknown function (DUF3108)